MRGVYPPVSSHYSQDIKDVIGKLLAVNPSHRPSVDDILKMPQVVARMALLPPSEGGAPPSTAQSVKSARSDLVRIFFVACHLMQRFLLSFRFSFLLFPLSSCNAQRLVCTAKYA
jgi:serine/threonine protein kinase